MNTILLIISMFLAILFTLANAIMWQRNKDIPIGNTIIWALGVLGILIHYLKIW